MKKKICMVVDNEFDHDTRVNKEARSLADAGYEVIVYAQKISGRKEEEKINGFTVKRPVRGYDLIRKKLWCYIRDVLPAYNLLVKENADVYHANDLPVLPICYIVSKKLNSKLVYDSHELFLETLYRANKNLVSYLIAKGKFLILAQVEKKLIKSVDKIITVNESIAGELKKRYGIQKVTVLMNVPSDPFSKDKGVNKFKDLFNKSGKIVLYQGGFSWVRGMKQLIESVRYFPKDTCLVLMGDGEIKPSLERLVQKNNLSDKIRFVPTVPLDELYSYTSSADVGIIPYLNVSLNHYYSTPNKLFEYMTAGLPMAVSDFPEMKKIVEENNVGVTFNPEDPKDIARIVGKILFDESRYKQMRENALRAAKEKYNWENEEKKLLDVYGRVLN